MNKRDELAENFANQEFKKYDEKGYLTDSYAITYTGFAHGYDAGVKESQDQIKMLVAALESVQSLALGAFDMPKTKFNAYCTEKSFRYASQALTQHRKMNEGK